MRTVTRAAFLVSISLTAVGSAEVPTGPAAPPFLEDGALLDPAGAPASLYPQIDARGVVRPRNAVERGSNRPGSLIWEDRYDASPFEQAFSAATHRDEVFVAGYVFTPTGRDFLLRVLDEDTGELEWQDQVDRGGDEFASGVVVDNHRVFVSGTSFSPGTGYDWILRAYDTRTHELLWEDVFDLAGRSDFARGTALAAGAGMVFLGGYGTDSEDQRNIDTDYVVRAYDAASGEMVWQDHIAGFSSAYTLAYHGERLFAGGWTGTEHTRSALVRAYAARRGTVLWSHLTPGADGFLSTGTRVVRAQGGRVFAAQAIVADGPVIVPRVKAFDAATGALRWEDVIDDPGSNVIEHIDVGAGRVFAVGSGGPSCSWGGQSNCDLVVRAYGAIGGTLLWKREVDLSGTDDQAGLVAAHPERGSVYVASGAGLLTPLPGCCSVGRWTVSAFDDSDGRLLWQTLGGEGDGSVYNMVVDRERLVIPGRSVDVETGVGQWDIIVRAYDTRGRRGAVEIPTPYQLAATGTSGTKSYGVTFDGPVTTAAHGLVPALEQAGVVVDDPADNVDTALSSGVGVTFHTVSVPPGTRTLRVALFDEETDGTNDDLDLFVFDSAFNLLASSAGPVANEAVNINGLSAGDYTVVVHGYETDGPDASYALLSWALGEAAAANLTVSGPAGNGKVTLNWSGLESGGRYFGAVSYSDGTGEKGETLVSVHAIP